MHKTTTSPALIPIKLPIPQVLAFSTTRQTPQASCKSNQPYDDFNLALHVGDEPYQVLKNRSCLLDYLPAGADIQWLNQVHGDNVVKVTSMTHQKIDADAVITQQKNLALAIMTADCLPIVLADESGSEIAVMHAGWKPLAKNIIAKTIQVMQTEPSKLIAWLGPCISQKHFEVGNEVKAQFTSLNTSYEQAFVSGESGKFFADLQYIANQQLSELGVTNRQVNTACTFANQSQFFSYRREQTTGRMATIACLT
ncbi:peptidoglycan editing factor PgeF [Thalassotalea eurytherma]|uniref:Purine nucleoside phosphorylase n=1 Tax=Thalassotalea eurytherma TaxID=1144278 RepID=A0ABQ6H0S1_9GAMM|nr:peptidoglycan editing factor PgeF [Thalassotalea eurytherma]GLX81798.1 laccase domain protein [Thalassotalea eurytherma]